VDFFKDRPKYSLIVRFHPFEAHLERVYGPMWAQIPNVSCDQTSDAPDLISVTDLCLCQRTSFGLECLALGKPLLEINYEHSKDDPAGYANQGIAGLISSPEELDKILQHLECAAGNFALPSLSRILEENFFLLDGKTSERVRVEVLDLLSCNELK
jgi:hypothetical protein